MQVFRIPFRVVITLLIAGMLSRMSAFGLSFVIDFMAEARLGVQVQQYARMLLQAQQAYRQAVYMASNVTHPRYWLYRGMSLATSWRMTANPYNTTGSWKPMLDGSGDAAEAWGRATVSPRLDTTYTAGPGTPFAAASATTAIADDAAVDALTSTQDFYASRNRNDRAMEWIDADMQSSSNDTYLGQAKIANGIGVQALSQQRDALVQQTNTVRLLTVLVKQTRDQNTDYTNFASDYHSYQTSGVQPGYGLASAWQQYTIGGGIR